MQKALDISKWQGSFDAARAKAAGISAVFCRCAYGTAKDACWAAFAPAVKAAGLGLGAYGFLTAHYRSKNGGSEQAARAEMERQVDAWLALCKPQGCRLLAIDQELEAGQSMALDRAQNTRLLAVACRRIRAAGLAPAVYASASWVQSYIDWQQLDCPFWVAYYPASAAASDFAAWADGTFPAGRYGDLLRQLLAAGRLLAWQYGSTGWGEKYGAASENIDRNWLYQEITTKEDTPMYTSDTLKIGPASAGDKRAIRTLAESLALPVAEEGDCLIVGPMSAGDRATVSNKALSLGLGCEDYTPPAEPETPQDKPGGGEPADEPDKPAGGESEPPGEGAEELAAQLAGLTEAMSLLAEKLDTLIAGHKALRNDLTAAARAFAGEVEA